MQRGDIWTVAAGTGYTGKPRPVVIVQSDRFDASASVTVCGFTSHETDAALFRVPVVPNDKNGLKVASSLMADKVTTVSRKKLGRRIGRLDDASMGRLDRALLVFLGLVD